MAEESCSHWWQALVYLTLASALALAAISSLRTPTSPSAVDATILTTNALGPALDTLHNASATLGSQGFTTIAALLKLSPEIFFPSGPGEPATIFALPDSAMANSSLPHWAQKLLLQYHTVPSHNLPFRALLRKSSNTCLATSVPTKNIRLTKIRPQERRIEINNARISHPDLFLGGSISIHGVLAPFTPLDPQEHYSLDFIRSPDCPALLLPQWKHVVRELGSHDFISFAVALNSVLQGILRDHSDLSSGTIFAPKELCLMDVTEPLLHRLVRYHILPQRYEFSDLASLPEKARLATLVKGKELEITGAVNATRTLSIGGVDLTTPAVCSTEAFVVHAISQAFDPDALSNAR